MRASRRRPGVTLIEVLVTIFIMGIGMLALLTLFPVGAMNMGRALKDDRAANAVVNADGIARAQSLWTDPLLVGPPNNYFTTFGGTTVPAMSGPSFGVYVDPIGISIGAPGSVGAFAGTPGLPRVSMSLQNYTARNTASPPPVLSPTEAMRWCTFLDDVQFLPNGTPDLSSGGVQRYGAYTWAWLLRQPQAGSTATYNMWGIVYRSRNTANFGGEATYAAIGTMFDTSVTVSATGLNLRTGSWVLDTTPAGNGAVPGYFYRVVDWYESTGRNQTTLQLETSLQGNVGVLTLMDNVVEVFNRGSVPQ